MLERFSTDLLQIVCEEERLVQNLAELEKCRKELIETISPLPDISLEDLVNEYVAHQSSEKETFLQLRGRLRDIISKIREINERNQKLLEQALELTRYSLGILTTPPREVVYQRPDTKKILSSSPALIDRKI